MENYATFANFMPDSKNSLLSLQFLDDVIQTSQQSTHHHVERISYQYDNQFSRIANYNQVPYSYASMQALSEKNDRTQYHEPQIVMSNIEPRNLFDHQSENIHQNYLKTEVSQGQQSQIQIFKNLDQSNISGSTVKDRAMSINIDHYPQSDLAMLKQLQQKAMETFNKTEYAQSVKQNFEALFQKVYGIIQQIEQRNQKSQASKSNLKISHKKQLSINPRVVQISLGKQNYGAKRKKYCNIQTELDYHDQEDIYTKNYMKTQQCIQVKTPCSSASKMMISSTNNTLSLSKHLPYAVASKSYINSARSDKSGKTKGITLVSAQKKYEVQEKKPVKITLMQKKIVLEGKKNVQPRIQTKTEKKTSAFNPNNFFNSRRVSTRIV